MNKIYEISQLVGRRVRKGKVEYRVRWKGFPPEEDTWELGSNLRESCPLLIRDFNSQARSKRGQSHSPSPAAPTATTKVMTAYTSPSPSPHSSPPLKKSALSECSSDQLSVMSAANCSPRSVSPALTALITPPLPAQVKAAEHPPPPASGAAQRATKGGTKRSPGKVSSSGSSPTGGRKKVLVVFNATEDDSPPLPPPCQPLKREFASLPAAKDALKVAPAKEKRPSAQAKKAPKKPRSTATKPKKPKTNMGKRAGKGKSEKGKRVITSGKKTREYMKLKVKSLTKMDKKSSPLPAGLLSPSRAKEPPLHQSQIMAAGSGSTRCVPVLIVYALDKIRKMKRKCDMENIHDLVSRMDTEMLDKKPMIKRTVAAMEKSGQLLRWEGNGGHSFRVAPRTIDELNIDNSDGYLSVASERNSPARPSSPAIRKERTKKTKEAKEAKKRKPGPGKEGVEAILPLPLTKRRKMLEEVSEMSGSSASLPPAPDGPKEPKSGNNSSAGSTASGSSSLVTKACSLIENIQNKSKTNTHVYQVGKHVLLVPPYPGGPGTDLLKQISGLPHKRFAASSGGVGSSNSSSIGSSGGSGLAPGSGPNSVPCPVPPAGGAIERRISVRQTESAFKFKEINVRKHEGFVEIGLQSSSGLLKNVFTLTTLSELSQALQSAVHDGDSRLVLLTGSSMAFCHGADLQYLSCCRSDATARYVEALRSFLVSLANFPKPIIAAVNGPAVGLGAALLPLCDLVYASDKAHLQLPYCHLGQTPEGGSSFTLPHLVGPAIAADMFMAGRRLTAMEAYQRGLVSEVFWPSVLMQQVIPRCRRIAQCPPLSLESTKCIIRCQMREQLIYAIESECSLLNECWETSECKRKIQEFMTSAVDSIL